VTFLSCDAGAGNGSDDRGFHQGVQDGVMTVDRRGVHALVAVVVLALVTGCGSAGSSAAEEAAASASAAPTVLRTPDPAADAVPVAPRGRPTLSITGRIGTTNADGEMRVDQAALDRLGLLEMNVNDPWAKQRLALQGVWLRDLVALAKPLPGATSLHLTALDDYQVDLKLDDVRADAILLASRAADGTTLPIEDGGPTRVVFADDLAPRFSPDLWIWNIDTIEVR
jgi:hypothetical protein